MTLEQEYQKALSEIGDIVPWLEDGGYYFRHDAYSVVDYMADTPEATVEGYKRVLKDFIRERMAGQVSPVAERAIFGRGGRREGAGRPRKPTSTAIRVPDDILDVVNWLREDSSRAEQVRRLMQA